MKADISRVFLIIAIALLFGWFIVVSIHIPIVKHRPDLIVVHSTKIPRRNGVYILDLRNHECVYMIDGNHSMISHKADCKYCQKESK